MGSIARQRWTCSGHSSVCNALHATAADFMEARYSRRRRRGRSLQLRCLQGWPNDGQYREDRESPRTPRTTDDYSPAVDFAAGVVVFIIGILVLTAMQLWAVDAYTDLWYKTNPGKPVPQEALTLISWGLGPAISAVGAWIAKSSRS